MKFEVTAFFDALEGGSAPTGHYGAILTGFFHDEAIRRFAEVCEKADNAIKDIFGKDLLTARQICELDAIISEMWEEGWNPNKGNLNLFTLHFGAILTALMLEVEGSTPIFRSTTSLDHVSVWHQSSRMEYFPLHKVFKCLTNREGESLKQMYNDLVYKCSGQHRHRL